MGRNTINPIVLTVEQREELTRFTTKGTHNVRNINRAKIILALDVSEGREPMTQKNIASIIGVSRETIDNAKRDFLAAESMPAFLCRKKRVTPPLAPKITGDVEAKIIALACGAAPEGSARWTLQLLADKSVELKYVDSLSDMSVHRLLKKHNFALT